jgi:TolA-binding protein
MFQPNPNADPYGEQEIRRRLPPSNWLKFLQLGLTGLLALMGYWLAIKTSDNGHSLQHLDQRIRSLETSRGPDQSLKLQEQLRAMADRLQTLEAENDRLQSVELRQSQERQLRLLQQATPAPSSAPVAPTNTTGKRMPYMVPVPTMPEKLPSAVTPRTLQKPPANLGSSLATP